MRADSARHVKGAILVDLIKFLKNYEKSGRQLPTFTVNVQKVLAERVLGSAWYPLAVFQELLQVMDGLVLRGDERRTMEMGVAGGAALRGVTKTYGIEGDPRSSVLAMRHAWRAHYDFGLLTAEALDANTVVFELQKYPDLSLVHGLLTAGWGVAAARTAGAVHAALEVKERPWMGAASFIYKISF